MVANNVAVFTCPVTFTAAVFTNVLLAVVDPTTMVEVLTIVVPVDKPIALRVEVFVEFATNTWLEL